MTDFQTPLGARLRRPDENIAAGRGNVGENRDTCIRHTLQKLNLCTTTLHRILTNDLALHGYKIHFRKKIETC